MKKKLALYTLSALMLVALTSMSAFAFTAPAAGDLMYNVYDLVINKMIGGGITYIVGFIGLVSAAYFIMQQKIVPGLFIIIGAIIFLSAGAMATAFGLCLM